MRRKMVMHYRSIVLISSVLICPVAGLQSQSNPNPWPMFHGNPQHTGQGTVNGPKTTNLRWKYTRSDIAQGTFFNTSSIDRNGTIYVNAANNLLALNSAGELQWSAPLEGNNATAISPDGATVYSAGGGKLYAFTSSGKTLWTYTLQDPTLGIFGEPCIASDGTIYFGSWDTFVYALNPDGTLKWKSQTDGSIAPLASPTLSADERTIFVGSGDPNKSKGGTLYAIRSDGTLLWQKKLDQARVSGAVAGSDGMVYAAAVGRVFCYSATGTKIWESIDGTAGSLAPSLSSDGTIYVGTAKDGKVYAINASNGQVKWSYQTGSNPNYDPSNPKEPQYGVLSTPVIGKDGTVYVGAIDGVMHALNPNGSVLWTYKTGSSIHEDSPALGPDGTLVFSSTDKFFYAIKDSTPVPAAPTLVSPADGATGIPTSPTLNWNPSSGATSYRLQVSTSNTFSSTVVDDSTITGTSKQIGPLANSTPYFWRVNAKNAAGSSPFSAARNFTTIVAAPAAPTPISPDNNSNNQPLSVALQWSAVSSADFYRVQLATNQNFSPTLVDDSTLTTPSRTISSLNLNTTYYWRVAAKNLGGTSSFSSAFSFRTIVTTFVEQVGSTFPTTYSLEQNYPNPFNPSTTIRYAIPKESRVLLEIYNLLGQRVATLVDEEQPAAFYQVHWNANGISSGVYSYRLQAGSFVETKKLLLLQ